MSEPFFLKTPGGMNSLNRASVLYINEAMTRYAKVIIMNFHCFLELKFGGVHGEIAFKCGGHGGNRVRYTCT
jgi:hypothetical protein